MDIFDILDKYIDELENGDWEDPSSLYHGELVDEYADGWFTVEVYADGYTVRYCDRD